MLVFDKFLSSNNKLLEKTIGGTHQYNSLIDLGSMHRIMSHCIGPEPEIVEAEDCYLISIYRLWILNLVERKIVLPENSWN